MNLFHRGGVTRDRDGLLWIVWGQTGPAVHLIPVRSRPHEAATLSLTALLVLDAHCSVDFVLHAEPAERRHMPAASLTRAGILTPLSVERLAAWIARAEMGCRPRRKRRAPDAA